MTRMKSALAFVLIASASLFSQSDNPKTTRTTSEKNMAKKAATTKSGPKAGAKGSSKVSAQAIHESALVIDTHADSTQRLLDEDFDMANPPAGDPGHLDLIKAKKGNLAADFFAIWVDPEKYKGQYAHRTLALIDSVYRQADKNRDKMQMCYSTADILAAHRRGKFCALMGIEGGHSIENDMGLLR